jgi:16S rRNA (guanine966-N2)-methyltransferase
MRVIAGRLKGRQFDSPRTFKTHPMSDKMRGALFNILGDLDGLTVLDAFAGSGALGFEAISRGATSALAIDSDRSAQKTIAVNIRALGLGREVKLITASVNAWLQTSAESLNGLPAFDIVLCDPPYNDLQPNLLQRLFDVIIRDGLFVLSWPTGVDPPKFDSSRIIEQRTYGDGSLLFYRVGTP